MGFWGSAEVSVKLGIVLGTLAFTTLVLGLIKVLLSKRRLARHSRHQEIEDAGKDDVIQLEQRKPGEGGMFGFRAKESGFYGGIAQSPTTTTSGSLRKSFDRNTADIYHEIPNNLSETTLVSSGTFTPSPKRLTLGFGPRTISQFDQINDYIEATESKASGKSTSTKEFDTRPRSLLSSGSGNPSRRDDRVPAHIQTQSIGSSYLTAMSPSPVSSSESSPVVHSFPLSPPPASRPDRDGFTTILPALPSVPPLAARRQERSLLDDGLDDERPASRKRGDRESTSWPGSPIPPNAKVRNSQPRRESCQPIRCDTPIVSPEDDDSPVRESVISNYEDDDYVPSKLSSASRRSQVIKSHPFPSITEHHESSTLSNSDFSAYRPQPPNHSRNTSFGIIKRTRNSIKMKYFQKEKKYSGEIDGQRDKIHYDPKGPCRNSSGSVQETSVDFDQPMGSPFSDSKALDDEMATRPRDSSSDSAQYGHHDSSRSIPQPVQTKGKAEDRKSASIDVNSTHTIPTISVVRFRGDSESSMSSISDMYESYLRKGIAKPLSPESDENGLFDIHIRTEYEQMEYERAERERNGLLSASAAVAGVRKKKSPPASLVLDTSDGKRVPKAIESPVSGWRI